MMPKISENKNIIKFIAALKGNGSRPSHRGPGFSTDNISYTLNSVEIHGVAYELSKNNRNIDGK